MKSEKEITLGLLDELKSLLSKSKGDKWRKTNPQNENTGNVVEDGAVAIPVKKTVRIEVGKPLNDMESEADGETESEAESEAMCPECGNGECTCEDCKEPIATTKPLFSSLFRKK